MAPVSKYDPLCDVVADWYEIHKQLTRDGVKIDGVRTPPAARHKYLYAAGIFDAAQRDGQAIWDAFSYIRTPDWPDSYRPDSANRRAFDARVAAWRMDLLREWQLVFHEKSRHLWTDEHRANVLRAVATPPDASPARDMRAFWRREQALIHPRSGAASLVGTASRAPAPRR
jgi:hypothetical protein